MEIRNLNTLRCVVETGSFTKAAEELGYTQSTVSFQIKQLEQELGCSLFDRYAHTISLTERGQLLLRHANKICRNVQDLMEDFNTPGEPKGCVRIISSDSICEKMMLLNYADFYRSYPGIQLIFSTGNTEDMFRMLYRHEADVMFTLDSHVYRDDFRIVRESPMPLHFVASGKSPLAGRKKIPIEELITYPMLLTEQGMSYRKILDEHLADLSLQVTPVLEASRTDIICRCIEEGPGVSFLPDFVTETKVREGKLTYLDVEGFDHSIWKQLIHHKEKWLSKAMTAFLDYVVAHEFEW